MVVSEESGKFTLEEFLSMRVKVSNFVIFAGLLLVWHLIFSVFGIYALHPSFPTVGRTNRHPEGWQRRDPSPF